MAFRSSIAQRRDAAHHKLDSAQRQVRAVGMNEQLAHVRFLSIVGGFEKAPVNALYDGQHV